MRARHALSDPNAANIVASHYAVASARGAEGREVTASGQAEAERWQQEAIVRAIRELEEAIEPLPLPECDIQVPPIFLAIPVSPALMVVSLPPSRLLLLPLQTLRILLLWGLLLPRGL